MHRFVVIDLETTGNSPKKGDKIIQFAAVVYENGEIIHHYSTFLNPSQPISPFIEQLTGINDEMVEDAPFFEEVAPIILNLLEDSYFVAHNVIFDLSFLQEELRFAGYEPFLGPVLDTVEMTRFLYPSLSSYRLSGLSEHFSFQHDRPHQADSDAQVTALLLDRLLTKLTTLPSVTIKKLLELSASFTSDLEDLLEDILMSDIGRKNDNQFDILNGIALRKIQNDNGRKEQKKKVSYPTARESFIEKVKANQLFLEGEVREGQLDMMDLVQNALHSREHALIEAGAGLGKTMAYLLPSAVHSISKGKRMVVSTNTVQLQHQLIQRDMPYLKEALQVEVSVAVLKGRYHYLSLFRFEQLLKESDDNYDSILTKAKILIWLTETETGDVEEINLPSGGQFLWERLSTDYSQTEQIASHWQNRCFYQQMKSRAEQADLIITNHSILCKDIFEEPFIPAYQDVIIDEAHHFADIVSEFLGKQLDYVSINYTLSRLGTLHEVGIIRELNKLLKKRIATVLYSLDEKTTFLKTELDELFRMLRSYALSKAKKDNRESNRIIYKFDAATQEGMKWNAIIESVNRIRFCLVDSITIMNQVTMKLEQENLVNNKLTMLATDFNQIRDRMHDWKESLIRLFLSEQDQNVTWMEIEEKGAINSTGLFMQPFDSSEMIADQLLSKKDSVIFTSATLSVQQSFEFMVGRLGLVDFQPIRASFPSPFDFSAKAQVLIPTDLPNIKAVSHEEYIQAISAHIAAIARVTRGRMLVLFTSYDMLRKTFFQVKDQFELAGITLIGQGISSGGRSKITKTFMQSEQAVLFGTSSFWEGVDFPGEALSCLIIIRLPFTPPSQPLFEAKARQLENRGVNSFNELSLPQAVLRFKQGFGRLIRSKEDKGVVFVFDKRIITTWYGKTFIESLPELSVKKGNLPSLLQDVKNWIN
ncbi:ATP-dependent DNA helicase DinG [Bacillus pinisoli]|uniref:ATP-dependent DNA helicase DinG n=1 Tax=Bacillus pinisoli TaxID=2901866 RepID=UPI001FF1BCA1|nr:ATP-dependent DNA helicase DinG [Bacillus pinisoli]